ncbi:MAG: inorganic phosphate transporter [Candidatus Azobacteroides pseudotrichonymphae]|jgi:PiT family inorganic phosphate transporter|uniref:Inorganic phosphate transporter n=1 Tax=Azobacteroides pseudotrichonymphae genomovar. CFP2 TaxID=511995 RepID=B6YQM8_AZOPC|nr:inorganic phosphate transporter [Candidatus Azobacteroides pseudotrichonymphae]BAG83500.1 inorganic phosphate transporter [Candidatus Azobacteroides pseudotrichonymphae genomovar. CFP2]GMO32887.1 MAG: inorganic phosphate transporter [Candidatus Azobacteroides pseudotrichonymphae]
MTLFVIIIILSLVFDFVNGFHDAANSIATIVSTRVLTPFQAVLWAASFNFIAFFVAKYIIGGFGIAQTVAKSVLEEFVTLPIILSGLIAAIIWNLLTWILGIPSSSSHTLIGGFTGASICGAGFQSIHAGVIIKIISFIVLAPLIGMIISFVITVGVLWISQKTNTKKTKNIFKKLQLLSSGLFSLGHGLNDSQKIIGIIATAMIAIKQINSVQSVPDWVPLACFISIGLGTMMGGWRIVKTMGTKITKVTALEGVCAETAGALTLFITEILKIPVSTTHTITGAIMGVGTVKRLSAVRWNVTINLLWAWILTIPTSALLASIVYLLIQLFGIV